MNSYSSSPARWVLALFSIIGTVIAAVLLFAPAARLHANPEDHLPVAITRALRPLGAVAVLTWKSAPGASYKVQFRTTLNAPEAWQDYDVVTVESIIRLISLNTMSRASSNNTSSSGQP